MQRIRLTLLCVFVVPPPVLPQPLLVRLPAGALPFVSGIDMPCRSRIDTATTFLLGGHRSEHENANDQAHVALRVAAALAGAASGGRLALCLPHRPAFQVEDRHLVSPP